MHVTPGSLETYGKTRVISPIVSPLYIGYPVATVHKTDCSQLTSIESLVHQHLLQWRFYVVRVKDNRIPKQYLYCELDEEKWPAQNLKLRYKDCIKNALKKTNIMKND